MRFKELTECPFCGSDIFYVSYKKEKVKGYSGKTYCYQCNKYLGDYIKNIVSKSVEKKLRNIR